MHHTPLMVIYTLMVFHPLFPYSRSRQRHHNVLPITNYGGSNACLCSSVCRRSRFALNHNNLLPHMMIVPNPLYHTQCRRRMCHQHLLPCLPLSVPNLLSESATTADHIIPSFGKTCLGLVHLDTFPARPHPSNPTMTTRHVVRNPSIVGSVCQYSLVETRGPCRW
jgi:hypothetical protein